MKKTMIKFLVVLALLIQLVIAVTANGSTTSTTKPEIGTSLTPDLSTIVPWGTSSSGEHSTTAPSTVALMNSLTEEADAEKDNNEFLASTTHILTGPFTTTPLTKDSENEIVTDAVPVSLPYNMTTEMVTDTNMMGTINYSNFSMSSQDPSVRLMKGSTPGPTTDAPVVGTEEMDNSTTVLAESTDVVDDLHTSVMENEIQTDLTGTSPKPVTSAESGSELGTSQVPGETTFILTENGTTNLGSPLITILDDDATTFLYDITTTPQQPSLNSKDMVSASIGPQKNFSVVLILSGNCSEVIQDEEDKKELIEVVKEYLVKLFAFLKKRHIVMQDATCGSILVELIIEMSEKDKTEFDLDMRENVTFTYKRHVLQVVNISVEDYVEGTTPPVITDDGGVDDPSSLNFQETLIFIVIGSVGGAFVLLSLFLLCQYLVQKLMRAGKKSFSPTDEPCIKLSDFNMAHTYIPRPQSIYSATTRSSFLPYESMEQGLGYSSASPTPYVYADEDQILEHYQEVVDKDQPVTPTTKTINDFGKSGIPSWDLPVLEGVVQEGANGPANVEEHKVATSSTFHSPPPNENGIPPPPTTSPPPPPPTVGYLPQGPEGNSLKSEDGSSHTEQSSGDTRQLIRAGNHDVGVDNPAIELDSAYF